MISSQAIIPVNEKVVQGEKCVQELNKSK